LQIPRRAGNRYPQEESYYTWEIEDPTIKNFIDLTDMFLGERKKNDTPSFLSKDPWDGSYE
jgi:hypothetical protein